MTDELDDLARVARILRERKLHALALAVAERASVQRQRDELLGEIDRQRDMMRVSSEAEAANLPSDDKSTE